MTNDFEAKLIHDSRMHDLLRQAEGGWRLKAALESSRETSAPSPAPRRRANLPRRAIVVAMLGALIIALTVAALAAA
jgi:ferric-dicitrate binding protein FerR (iron transport regulator)